MKKNLSKIINELNKQISSTYPDFKGLYLYGSRAKGTYTKDSDIDVVAVFDEINREKDFELSGIICDLMYKYNIYIDLHSYTPDKLKNNPVYYNEVVNKGLFYGAA
ncbi:MAG: nucleotidyltransferase domain-containing protein [Candidatus Gastranaerophilaceae bacterium]|jgi:predicted nucleotidyltransferase